MQPFWRLKLKLASLVFRAIGEDRYYTLLAMYGKKLWPFYNFRRKSRRGENWNATSRCAISKYGDNGHQYFFGYYDLMPIDKDENMILSIRINKNASVHSEAQIGYFHLNAPQRFIPVGRTTTWCWQQGCRLQWYPKEMGGENEVVIYNKVINRQYGAVIQNIKSKKVLEELNYPIYAVSSDGSIGLTLNFSRLGRLRPGYGYDNFPDPTKDNNLPDNDGIWCVDLNSGEKRLILDLPTISEISPHESMAGAVHYVNHLDIGPGGDRFLFFHIWLKDRKRYTRMLTADLDGRNICALANEGLVSHYAWKSQKEILCFGRHKETGMKYHLYRDRTQDRIVIGKDDLKEDGHPSYSFDGRDILTDTYPDADGFRHLLCFDGRREKLNHSAALYSPFFLKGMHRCDLHPRWSPSGKMIAFDSAHDGKRALYTLQLK
jgi:hypothetical protein